VEVHHVRKLADLGQPGPLQPRWAKAMANRRRKTIVGSVALNVGQTGLNGEALSP
jgi:hypothetical protein